MADNSIGDWAVKLKADASGLVQGLQQSSNEIAAFSRRSITATKALTSAVNSAMSSITRVNLGAQSSALQGMAGSAGMFAASLASGNVIGMVSNGAKMLAGMGQYVNSGLDSIAMHEKLSRKIGISAQESAGLGVMMQRAAIAPEVASKGMDLWVVQLGKIRHELDSGGGALTTSLSHMGIDAREFVGLSLPEQFARIAEASQGISNPMERQAALAGIIGRRNMELAPLFAQSADSLRDMAGAASSVGIHLSQADAQKAAASVRAMRDASASVSGMFEHIHTQASVSLAEPFEQAAGMMKRLAGDGRGLLETVTAGAISFPKAMLQGGLVLTDFLMPAIEGWADMWGAVMEGVGELFGEVWDIAKEFGGGIAELFGGEVSLSLKGFGEMVRDLGKWWKEVFHNLSQWIRGIAKDFAMFFGMIESNATILGIFKALGVDVAEAQQRMPSFRDTMNRIAAGSAAVVTERPLDRLIRDLGITQTELNAARRETQALGGDMNDLMRTLRAMKAQQLSAADAAKASNITPNFAGMATMREMEAEADRVRVALRNMMTMPEGSSTAEALHQMTLHLREQVVAAGLTADELERLKFAQLGATQAQQAAFQATQQVRNAGDATAEARRLNEELLHQYATMGMSANEARIFRLQMQGASSETIKASRTALEWLERSQEIQKLREDAMQLRETLSNPVERFQQELQRLNDMRDEGVLSPANFDRGVMAAFQKLDGAFDKQQRAPAAAQAGSVEAARLIAEAQRQEQRANRDPIERLQAIAEQQREVAVQQRDHMAEFVRLARDGFFDVVR